MSNTESKNLIITPLHRTFGAEVAGVDFSKPLADETFAEILAACIKVRIHSKMWGHPNLM
jgi:alpha-ketoglutarate-dependent 2,4-dichlorophenoxyacetate dioxygenase